MSSRSFLGLALLGVASAYPANEAPANTPVYNGTNLDGKSTTATPITLDDSFTSWNVDDPDTWTVGIWVQGTNIASYDFYVDIFSKGSYGAGGGMFFIGMRPDAKVFVSSPANLRNMITPANPATGYQLEQGKWTHIAAVFNSGCEKIHKKWPAECYSDSGPDKYGYTPGITEATSDGMLDLYIDGELFASYPNPGGMSASINPRDPDRSGSKTRPISIGGEGPNGSGPSGYNNFNGIIACPYMSKGMLTPQEIAALAADNTACPSIGGAPTSPAPQGPAWEVAKVDDTIYKCNPQFCLENALGTRHEWARVDRPDAAFVDADVFTATTSDGEWTSDGESLVFASPRKRHSFKFACGCAI